MSKVIHKEKRVPFWVFPACITRHKYNALLSVSWSWDKVTCKKCLAKMKKEKGGK